MNKPFYTIGIGASAGGVSSLSEFFDHITPDINVAFVVVTHLLRDRRSVLDQILSKHSNYPVIRVEKDMRIIPGTVYVMVENTVLEANQGWLRVKTRDKKILNSAVDIFFNSLADDYKEKAIGVILSGGGMDGLEGSIWINHMGGKVMVEDPASAHEKGMPISVITEDHPSEIMSPTNLAKRINELCS